MSLPVAVAIKHCNSFLKPVVLYGAEVGGCENYILERLQPIFLSIAVNIRMVVYWAKLVSSNLNKIYAKSYANIKHNLGAEIPAYLLRSDAMEMYYYIRDMRICQNCRKDIGNEYHYLLCCPQFTHERTKNSDPKFWKKSSAIQMEKAMTNVNIRKLCLFVKFILSKL